MFCFYGDFIIFSVSCDFTSYQIKHILIELSPSKVFFSKKLKDKIKEGNLYIDKQKNKAKSSCILRVGGIYKFCSISVFSGTPHRWVVYPSILSLKGNWWFVVFKSEPPLPPSPAQAVQKRESRESDEKFSHSIKRLLTNVGYLLLLLSYGINVGIFYAISTLLNQIVLQYFKVNTFLGYLRETDFSPDANRVPVWSRFFLFFLRIA